MSDVGFLGLGISVLIHVLFVTITMGVGWITAFSRYIAYRKNDVSLEKFARRTFRVLVVFELFSGVWGTIITVFLAGFFPTLTALATNVLFAPLLIALISIMIRLPSIGIFWYTWDKIHPRIHSTIGFIMAISGFTIPFGFRAIFSEITAPTAIAEFVAKGFATAFASYSSIVFWLLYLHTVFAALSVGGFVVAFISSLDKDLNGIKIGNRYGLYFLIAQVPIGLFYWLSLRDFSYYMFDKITFGSFLPILALKITVALVLLIIAVIAISAKDKIKYQYPVILSLLVVFLGELMNSGARYPYMVILGKEGIHFSNFLNFYIEIPMTAVFVILAFLVVSIIIFSAALFYTVFKRYLLEFPE